MYPVDLHLLSLNDECLISFYYNLKQFYTLFFWSNCYEYVFYTVYCSYGFISIMMDSILVNVLPYRALSSLSDNLLHNGRLVDQALAYCMPLVPRRSW